ncbi:hypothetical protein LIER_00396 [Lithospermum erythrorhizon]|uniref:Uncharacterized protein n=1 Tax=Lithospermum erythrorhizon TaxID=34254 RepID=A0AAV3NIB7_LITER
MRQGGRLLGILFEIGSHWPQLVREFVCNVSEEIVDPASFMFHKVKHRGHVFRFSPALINKHYGMQNEGITRATLKMGDIIGELTGKTLSTWPTKGQLQASNLSLKYAVLHKAVIDNLVPTLNNTNVSEALDRILYVMGTDQQLNIDKDPHVLKKEDGLGEDAKSLTISDKLMKEKHVIDVKFNASNHTEPVLEEDVAEMLIKVYEKEQQRLKAEIQAKKVRVSELQAKIQALKTVIPPIVNDPPSTSIASLAEPAATETSVILFFWARF